jgi:pyrimidine operon attenuation protein/uracil phosphoribosyltransferase
MSSYTGRLILYTENPGEKEKQGLLIDFAHDSTIAVIEVIESGRIIRLPVENIRFAGRPINEK